MLLRPKIAKFFQNEMTGFLVIRHSQGTKLHKGVGLGGKGSYSLLAQHHVLTVNQ